VRPYDIRPAVFGLVDNLITQSSHYGKQTEVYNGVTTSITARLGKGVQVSGGVSVGKDHDQPVLRGRLAAAGAARLLRVGPAAGQRPPTPSSR
jgi:hypothetical protein